jgi:hypothetical protein
MGLFGDNVPKTADNFVSAVRVRSFGPRVDPIRSKTHLLVPFFIHIYSVRCALAKRALETRASPFTTRVPSFTASVSAHFLGSMKGYCAIHTNVCLFCVLNVMSFAVPNFMIQVNYQTRNYNTTFCSVFLRFVSFRFAISIIGRRLYSVQWPVRPPK